MAVSSLPATGSKSKATIQVITSCGGALDRMETFCNPVAQGLADMAFEKKLQLLRLVVERITVEGDLVKVESVIPTNPRVSIRPSAR